MYCLRCGRDTKSDHVFCDQCQQNMAQYPVKPDTPIHLPRRKGDASSKKKARRKKLSSEEQILQLKASLRRTRALVAALLLVVAVSLGALYYFVVYRADRDLGKNYTIDSTTQQAE